MSAGIACLWAADTEEAADASDPAGDDDCRLE